MQLLTVSRRSDTAEMTGSELREADVQRAKVLYPEGRIRQLWHRADEILAHVCCEKRKAKIN